MTSKTGLNFSIFSLELKETAKTGMIPEDRITTYQLKPGGKKGTLNDKIKNIKLESNGKFGKFSKEWLEKTLWSANDFLIKLTVEEEQECPSSLKGKISFYNTRKNVDYACDFQFVDVNENTLLWYIRDKKKLVLLALQGEETGEIYHTESRFGKFTVYSLDMNWTPERLSADKILFNKAKAVIHTEKGDLVLRGEKILYSKKDNLLTGYSATIIDLPGKKHGKNNTINVFLEKPLEFKIE
ncbi:MAG: hypothetical protein GTO45_09895 [Candidatus Aminicenantes bacterium]|nr:hypothetical protein [Candidatus Aminicenantes bacterium]NIN42293.1 hypothetical protein [Candidatus Aminicenantes bacterium]NIN85059.1 hypothetical protein [Candidatus Aminicenantes bacterium]